MRVGDLVTISYERERIGIIVSINKEVSFGYKVKWLREGKTFCHRDSSYRDFGHYTRCVLVPVGIVKTDKK